MNQARRRAGGAGTQTAGFVFGGEEAPPTKLTSSENYNGSSWTSGASLNKIHNDCAGDGVQTAAMCINGDGSDGSCEIFDGTSFASTASMSADRQGAGAAGTTTSMTAFGGGSSTATEEFTPESSALNIKTVTTS